MKAHIYLVRIILAAGMVWLFLFGCMMQGDVQEEGPCRKRSVPVITFKNLSPPYMDYEYFVGIEKYGFQFKATTFSLINAWWLAEVSTLVYADELFVRTRLKMAGLPEMTFFDKNGTQCVVANNDDFAIVAFRGSEIWKKRDTPDPNEVFADLKADVDIRLTDWAKGGKVHRGFKEALDEVWPDLMPYIKGLDNKGCKIWITGHSLGGALATLCSDLLDNVQGTYTLGSPRVGNEDFSKHLRVKVYRIVNNNDIVSRTPTLFVYVHVGELKFIESDGTLGTTVVDYGHRYHQTRDQTYGQANTSRPKKNRFKGFVPAPFRDHVPMLYAVHLWNILNEQEKK